MAIAPNSTTAPENPAPSRRALLLGGAAGAGVMVSVLPSLAGAAPLAAPDPIFAAIEDHKAAWEAYEGEVWRGDTVAARAIGLTLTDADAAILRAADKNEEAAAHAFIATVPTTPAGARAMIEHFIRHRDEFESAYLWPDLLESLLASPVLTDGGA